MLLGLESSRGHRELVAGRGSFPLECSLWFSCGGLGVWQGPRGSIHPTSSGVGRGCCT